jgi:hypothetical protein
MTSQLILAVTAGGALGSARHQPRLARTQKLSLIFSAQILLEASLLDSALDGFFRVINRIVPRAALPGYLGPDDGRGPLPKVAFNALHN